MVFSTDTIKAALNNKDNRVSESSYSDSIYDKFNECIETFSVPTIEENNYIKVLNDYIVNSKDSIINLFNNSISNINNGFRTRVDYRILLDPDIVKTVNGRLSNTDSIDFTPVAIDIKYLNKVYNPGIYLVKVKHIVSDIKQFVDSLNNIARFDRVPEMVKLIDDYISNINNSEDDVLINMDFLATYPDNNISTQEIINRDIFDTPNYGKKLEYQSQYVISYLNDLASSLRELAPIELSDKFTSVIRSKVMAIVSYKIKMISHILNEFINYSLNFIKSSEMVANQNVVLFNYIYGRKENTIDANTIDTDLELDESYLFDSLLSAYKEACEGANELDSIIESTGLITIQEAANANLMKYLHKVVNSISEAWKKFRIKMDELRKKAAEKFTRKLKQNAESLPEDFQFQVQNFPVLNETAFNTVKVIPFNFEQMKDHLRSADDLSKFLYPSVNRTEGNKFSQDLEKTFVKASGTIRITKQFIMDNVVPILESSDNVTENSAKTDIEVVNKSAEAIGRLSSNPNAMEDIPSVATEVPTNTTESAILEGENDVKIIDDPNRTATADKQSILKDVSVYLSVSSTILSTKLRLIRKRQLTAFRILAHAFAPPKKKETA